MMKRILYVLLAVSAIVASGCKETLEPFSVTPLNLEFTGDAGTKTVTVTAVETWALKIEGGGSWLTTSRTYGRSSEEVEVSVTENAPESRSAEIVFSCAGQSITVKVSQAAGSAEETIEKGEFYPDPASGIELDPVCPDADKPCTIKFNPASDNPLYGYNGELYAHLGIVVDGEWKHVPSEWGVADEKVHFRKTGDNSWELELKPTVREYFQSGDTPVTRLAIIVRTEDGSIKSHNDDQFCSATDSKYQGEVFTPDPLVTRKLPEGSVYGINYNADGSVTFVLYDKDKSGNSHKYCYIVGEWNDWTRKTEGSMYWDGSQGCWWITLDGFDPDKEYRFQYRLGNASGSDTYVSDPYTEIVYDQWNDQYIPGVPAFPEGAKQLISAFRINKPVYNWKHSDFQVKDKNDLVIYEMLFRDFTKTQDIAGAMAQLDYIENLGVTAVQLMPVQEFDGNLSWGYNPNHWFALDKYYGTREEYKAFIDECHARGIAVIIDVVYNHATGQHPWTKMWWNGSATSESNPFFNVAPTHPYNVYHDMNHENPIVKEHVKRSLEYLLTEYDVDGFRFDLTKGFTQTDSGGDNGDVAKWGRYDQSRVDILKGYADHIWSVNENAVVIFEHLADWDEEKVLAEHGMQLWRNVNHEYRNAVGGGAGNFSNMYSNAPFGGFVGYMESHDEERLCYGVGGSADGSWGICGTMTGWSSDVAMAADGPFVVAKNVTFTADDEFKLRFAGDWGRNYGTSAAGYKLPLGEGYKLSSNAQNMKAPAAGTFDVYFCEPIETIWIMTAGQRPEEPEVEISDEDPLTVAMRRAGASAAFFLTVPGPKMIWQFGEIGYDYTIEHNGRTGEKPVVTDEYLAVPARKALYDTYASLLKFRRENPRFFDSDAKFEWTPAGTVKEITCSVDGKTFYVVGNFGKSSVTVNLPEGQWTDYMNDNTSFISGSVTLKEGEFKLLVR